MWLSVLRFFITFLIQKNWISTQLSSKPGDHTKKYPKGYYRGVGFALGMGIGTAFGLAMDNLAAGIAIGAAIGIALSSGLEKKYNSKSWCSFIKMAFRLFWNYFLRR